MRAIADELGDEASIAAQSLRTNVIGIRVTDIEPFSAELLEGAEGRTSTAAPPRP